jgi:hypothetical protein
MPNRFRNRLTFANVTSVLALFVALGGSATAALVINGKNIKAGSITGKSIKNNTIGSSKITDGDLLAKDFKAGELPAGAQGPQGAQGVPGAPGTNGQNGAPGPSDIYAVGVVSGALGNDSANPTTVASLTLPAGSYLIEAKLFVHSTTDNQVWCHLRQSVNQNPFWDYTVESLAVGGYGTVMLAGADTFTADQTVRVLCWGSPNAANFTDARLWAIKTGSLHATLPLPHD